MKYIVVCAFNDIQDKGHLYKVGSTYPREGMSTTDKRISELSTDNNKAHKPLIVAEKRKRGKSNDNK